MKKILGEKKGVMLLELIIVIGMVGILIPLIFSVLGLGNRTFNSGVSKRDMQQQVRITSMFIVEEIRYTKSDLKLTNTEPSSGEYIRVGASGVKKFKDGSLVRNLESSDVKLEGTIGLEEGFVVINLNDYKVRARPFNYEINDDDDSSFEIKEEPIFIVL